MSNIHMPDMNGLELLQEIYSYSPQTAVIIISGYEQFQYARTALKYKARGYILKPIDTDELFGIVDNILYELRHTEQLRIAAADGAKAEPEASAPKAETYHLKLIRQAVEFIEQNLHLSITLNEVASQYYLTPHYFGQIFKLVTGKNFTTFITQLRMQKACELLKNPTLKHYDICRQIGYYDVKYFTKQFQRSFKLTPKEYRQHYYNS